MARKQVIVQLDDGILSALDRAAEEAGLSRSELLRRAARLYLEALEEATLDRQHAEGYRRFPPTDEDIAWVEASMRTAGQAWAEDPPSGR
jgi:metal-responsive CopG/Arc/MetJ family transcriptional regulator